MASRRAGDGAGRWRGGRLQVGGKAAAVLVCSHHGDGARNDGSDGDGAQFALGGIAAGLVAILRQGDQAPPQEPWAYARWQLPRVQDAPQTVEGVGATPPDEGTGRARRLAVSPGRSEAIERRDILVPPTAMIGRRAAREAAEEDLLKGIL